ncbi:MAG TPA: hypothetical protein VFQ53_33480 [Kofleriaceae bacterium]|nr:hypothetical protein [Kofleriaceae bacterium]
MRIDPALPRDVSLVVADEPIRSALVEGLRANGCDAIAPKTPLDMVQALIAWREQIGSVVISSASRWAHGLRDFLADEYPEIEPVMLAS